MAKARFCSYALIALLSVHFAFSADPPQISPAPAPQLPADAPSSDSPVSDSGAPASAPANAPHSPISSPPSPPPSDSPPASSPSTSSPPTPVDSPVPSPSPSNSTVSHSNVIADADATDSSSGGMSAGKKLGITAAVILCAGVVFLGGLIYKKRQDNIRRSQYSSAARREML